MWEREVSVLRRLLLLIGTFLLVYFLAPWLSVKILHLLPVEHPERIQSGVAILTTISVYSYLRRRFGDRVPQV